MHHSPTVRILVAILTASLLTVSSAPGAGNLSAEAAAAVSADTASSAETSSESGTSAAADTSDSSAAGSGAAETSANPAADSDLSDAVVSSTDTALLSSTVQRAVSALKDAVESAVSSLKESSQESEQEDGSDQEKDSSDSEDDGQTSSSAVSDSQGQRSFYQKLASGEPVSILIIGDSIGESAGTNDSARKWFNLLTAHLADTYYDGDETAVTLTNISMSGNSSYAGYVSTMTLVDGISYDLSIICYGQNDFEEDFALYYEAIIRAVWCRYPDCSILSVLESSQRTYTAKITAIQELCSHYGIPTVDTILAFEDSGHSYDELSDDGIHPNALGYAIYAEATADVIDACVAADIGLPDYSSPYNEEVTDFDHLIDFTSGDETGDGVTQFVRTSDSTYTLFTSVEGIPGLDFTYETGDEMVELYIDGAEYAAPVVMLDEETEISQRYILTLGEEYTVKNEITVVFNSEEQADGFYGMCFSW